MSDTSSDIFTYVNTPKKLSSHDVIQQVYCPNGRPLSEMSKMLNLIKESNNMTNLKKHSEASMLNSLRGRLKSGIPFTYAGNVLISVNSEAQPSLYFNKGIRSKYSQEIEELPPHIYSTSLSAYEKLKTTKENQVIAVLGESGSGKTFNVIHLVDHLVSVSSSDFLSQSLESDKKLFHILHEGMQALHIMGSSVRKHNLESTACAMITELKFDKQFKAVGGQIKATLMDFSLPIAKKGRSYQLLHSLLGASKSTLQKCGLHGNVIHKLFESPKQRPEQEDGTMEALDREIWERFMECLNELGIEKAEILGLEDVLAIVIHLHDIYFVENEAGFWIPRNKYTVQKICKLLVLPEDKFYECFSIFKTKSEAEFRIRDLARTLYSLAFSWLNDKINERLEIHCSSLIDIRIEAALSLLSPEAKKNINKEKKEIYENCLPAYSIMIVDFPGFAREKSMGSFTTNITIESLNYYCCNNYIKLLDSLERENIGMPVLNTPNCKHIVDLCLGKGSGLIHFLSADNATFKEYVNELHRVQSDENLPYKDIISFIEKNDIIYHFSWGSVKYDLTHLRNEAEGHYTLHLNSFFLRKCNSKLISVFSSVLPNFYLNQLKVPSDIPSESIFAEKLALSISSLIQPLVKIEPHIIYCIKAPEKEIQPGAVFLFRNSLILPTLLWTWYGFPHWINIEDVIKEFPDIALRISGAQKEVAKGVLAQVLPSQDFIITGRYVLLKEKHMNQLQDIIKRKQKIKDDTIDLSLTHSDANFMQISESSPFSAKKSNSIFRPKDFHVEIYDDRPQPKITSKENLRQNIQTNSFEKLDIMAESERYVQKLLTKQSVKNTEELNSSIISNGKNKDQQENIVKIESFHAISKLFRSMGGYMKMDYSGILPEIIRIQSMWRGCKAREFYNGLKFLHEKAKTIQRIWKGWHTRMTLKPVFQLNRAVIMIQRAWRSKFTKKKSCIIKIQRWYKAIVAARKFALSYEASISKKSKSSKHTSRSKGSSTKKQSKPGSRLVTPPSSKRPTNAIKPASSKQSALNTSNHQSSLNTSNHQSLNTSIHQTSLNTSNHQGSSITSNHQSLNISNNQTSINTSNRQPGLNTSNHHIKVTQKHTPNSSSTKDRSPKSRINQSIESPDLSPFSPRISSYSRELAQNKRARQGNDYVPFEERFKILENQRQERLHNERQKKVEEELKNLTHSPKINRNAHAMGNFLDRQQEYVVNAKLKLSTQQINKVDEEILEATFSPKINKTPRSRNPDQIVSDLYTWAKLKENQLKKAREAKIEEEDEEMAKFRLSDSSLRYVCKRKKKIEDEAVKQKQFGRETSPYWPGQV
ncbi:unnamed protein product [Blepharisma stoltei]|uniref:Myosin motor domain-containing protein n=1 Tax=Blepharisma stoltei TaxID=1481888 RepID=A0AAU9JJN2_9CILI|nr:unnamed protein product [Blepharisma stoltei]